MKNKQRRYKIIFIGCVLTLILAGCSKSLDNKELVRKTAESSVSKVDFNPDDKIDTAPVYSASEKNRINQTKNIDLTHFKKLQKCFIKYTFHVKRNGSKEKPAAFEVKGRYDLNKDGKADQIKLMLKDYAQATTYIKVNNLKKKFYMDHTNNGKVGIIDLDKKDHFLEVAYFDEGPSGDRSFTFFRYDGKRLYQIGCIDASALVDESGKLVSDFNLSCLKPVFCSAWYEIKNNKLVQKKNDTNQYLGLTYDFAGGDAYFMPLTKLPDKLYVEWDKTRHLDENKLKLIDIYYYPDSRILNYYFVEFPSGEKGLLYFWIGDK